MVSKIVKFVTLSHDAYISFEIFTLCGQIIHRRVLCFCVDNATARKPPLKIIPSLKHFLHSIVRVLVSIIKGLRLDTVYGAIYKSRGQRSQIQENSNTYTIGRWNNFSKGKFLEENFQRVGMSGADWEIHAQDERCLVSCILKTWSWYSYSTRRSRQTDSSRPYRPLTGQFVCPDQPMQKPHFLAASMLSSLWTLGLSRPSSTNATWGRLNIAPPRGISTAAAGTWCGSAAWKKAAAMPITARLRRRENVFIVN